MNQAEEDALINGIEIQAKKVAADLTVKNIDPRSIMREAIRLAIRAAVAAERARCAKVADNHAKRDFTWGSENSDRYHAQADWAARIADAIRRGE